MTTSTKKEKVQKKQGPIRTGVVVPLVLVVLLGSLYAKLFLDSNLRCGLEYALTKMHKAQVDIDDFKSSFMDASVKISNISFTDKKDPNYNLISLGEISFALKWDGLLRGKFIVDKFVLNGVSIAGKRASPGKILPEEEQAPIEESKPGVASKVASEVQKEGLNVVKKEYEGNALGNVAKVLEGDSVGEQIGEIRESLASEKFISDLETELKSKEESLQTKIKSLPKKEDIDNLAKKIKETKLDSNPLVAAKQLKEFKKDYDSVSDALKTAKSTFSEINSLYGTLESSYKRIDSLIEEDMANLGKRFGLPNIDTKSLGKGLFGNLIEKQLGEYAPYLKKIQQYMPPKKTAEEKAKDELEKPKPLPRAKGLDYRFPKKGAYPLFWVKEIAISSEVHEKGEGESLLGKGKGQGANWTSNARLTNKPMTLKFNADFPKKAISGLGLDINLNHQLPTPNEMINFSVGSFPVEKKLLSKSETLSFGLNKAQGSLVVNIKNEDDKMAIIWKNVFRNVDYLVESNKPKVQQIFQDILKGIPTVTLDATATGTLNNLNWSFDSNLGEELSNGLKRVVNERIKDAKAKLRQKLDQKIGPKRKQFEEKFAKFKSKANELTGKHQKEIEEAKDKVKGEIDGKAKGESSPAQKGKDVLKGFKKKFKL